MRRVALAIPATAALMLLAADWLARYALVEGEVGDRLLAPEATWAAIAVAATLVVHVAASFFAPPLLAWSVVAALSARRALAPPGDQATSTLA